ncbi:26281_t:CDS:2, partial [Dentiscutata erythropus]
QQYPTNSLIEARYQSGNKPFYNWYNVQSLGYYPTQLKFTQKNLKEGIQYPIPDEYRVETSLIKKQIRCETKYQSNEKVKFIVKWIENKTKWSLYSDKSASNIISSFLKLSGSQIFGFDI